MVAASLDERLYYSMEDIRILFTLLGETGRQSYFTQEIFDLSFIFVYTVLNYRIAGYLRRRMNLKMPIYVSLLCFAPGFWDIIETTGIMALLHRWPVLGGVLPGVIMIATPMKWSAGLCLMILLVLRALQPVPPPVLADAS